MMEAAAGERRPREGPGSIRSIEVHGSDPRSFRSVMLRSLHINNLAVVEEATLEFGAGLTAITGETGAGKSVLIGALELALGGRGSADSVRAGQKLAVIEAVLDPPLPAEAVRVIHGELGLEWNEREPLVIRREVSAQGRSRCFVAEQMVGVGDLARLGDELIDLHGQHEHQSLFRVAAQRAALDAYGGHEARLQEYRGCYERTRELRKRHMELEARARDFEQQMDFLNHQIGELEEVSPEAGELEGLEAEEARLANAEALSTAAREALALLYEGDGDDGPSAVALLGAAKRALGRIARMDASQEGLEEKAGEIEVLIEDLAAAVRDYGESCEADPARLEEVIGRSEILRRLMRKHGQEDESGLVERLAELRAERDALETEQVERGNIDAELAKAEKATQDAAAALTKARSAAAGKFSKEVSQTLARVGMGKAAFDTALDRLPECGPAGCDHVEFLLAPNVGEGKKPLKEIASGGELSRTMLAIKTVLAARDGVATLVFDEVDAGISGETAAQVGRLMEELGGAYQVICITHHAAIAARAGRHISVSKTSEGGRTRTSAETLGKEARLEELARMMGGDGSSAAGKKLAAQLMKAGQA